MPERETLTSAYNSYIHIHVQLEYSYSLKARNAKAGHFLQGKLNYNKRQSFSVLYIFLHLRVVVSSLSSSQELLHHQR